MVNCPSCGAANTEDSLECVACNVTLQTICPVCGCRNTISSPVCQQCGKILINDSDPKMVEKRLGDPVAEMYEPINKPNLNAFPKKSLIKLVLGAFAFGVLYLSRTFEGHPLLLLIGGILTGLLTLWGLIEITFWFIDDKDLVNDGLPTSDHLENDFPDSKAPNVVKPLQSFVSTEEDIKNSIQASSNTSADDIGTPLEPTPEVVAKSPSADKHYETLAEFLEDGLNSEIDEIKEKQKKNPNNFALMLRLAQLYEERGELDNAIANLDACIKTEPDSAEVYLYYGTLLRRKGRLLDAQKAFEKALELNRFLSKAFYQLGLLEKSKGNLSHSKELLQRAIQLSPDDPYAHYQLGMTYKELGEIQLAIMEIKRATILHPSDTYGHSRLGQLYQQTKQYDLAIASYSRAISISPKDSYVLEKLGDVLAEKGDYERAADLYQETIANQLHPEVGTMLSLAKVYRQLGHNKELEEISAEILRFEPDNYEALYLKAYAVRKLGRNQEAIKLFEELVQNNNSGYEAWLELGMLYQSIDRPDLAVSAFTKAATGAPDQAGLWNNIGIILSNQKMYVEALKAFKKAASFDYTDQSIAENLKVVQKKIESDSAKIIERCKTHLEKHPDDIETYFAMGEAYEKVDMQDDALICYQKVLAIDPKHLQGLMKYAELLRIKGKLKMAMRCYREIIKLEPNNLEAHLFMINANLNLGFVNEAYKHATTAEKIAAEDPRVRFLLGKIYFAKGLAPRALKEFTTVADSSAEPEIISWAELMRKRLSRNNNQ